VPRRTSRRRPAAAGDEKPSADEADDAAADETSADTESPEAE